MSVGNFGEEPLSLGTFDPEHAQAPYLNTPRSLEACRRFGINPIELVEVGIDEFRKDSPDDLDAAQRRFERIDGARRRMMTNVMTEWKVLCDTEWTSHKIRPRNAKEAILRVKNPEAHSQLLEIQAEQFRKIEKGQFDELQRMLAGTITKADQEVKNNAIINKHQEAKIAGDSRAQEMQEKRAALLQQQLLDKKEKEEIGKIRIKELQQMDAELAKEKLTKHEAKLLKEKQNRERREAERLQREEYTRKLKLSIVEGMNKKAEQQQKLANMKSMESQKRKDESEAIRQKEIAAAKRAQKERQDKARSDTVNAAEEARNQMLDSIAADEMKRTRIKTERTQLREFELGQKGNESYEKRKAIYAATEQAEKEKKEKTAAELQFKDMLAKQELDKVQLARNKRQQIKSIRQEAYDLSATRQKKADQYKMLQQKKLIRDKNDKCQAIQDGFRSLSEMRNKMKDIVDRTTIELKTEIHNMNHKGILTPDKVMKKSVEIAQHALFPKLKSTFGLINPMDETEKAHIDGMIGETATDLSSPGGVTDKLTGNLMDTHSPKKTEKVLPIRYMNSRRLEDTLSYARHKIDVEDAAELEKKTAPPRPRSKSPKKNRPGSRGGSPETKGAYTGGKLPAKFEEDKSLRKFEYGEKDNNSGKTDKGVRSHKSTFMETGDDQFRREYSGDHPLAGGTGKYKNESKKGKAVASVKKMSYPGTSSMTPKQANQTIERLSLQSQVTVVDPDMQLEQLRREQNEALMRVLEEEKGAEESRERMSKAVFSEQEAQRMELVFAEERRRASERIVKLTKEHENRIKDAVLAMMSLKKHKN